MRKVTRDMCKAFIAGKRRANGNTHTDNGGLFLHYNLIARIDEDGYHLTMAGWPTVTTRERLNGLCELLGLGRPFHQKRGVQYFRDKPIDPKDWVTLPVKPGRDALENRLLAPAMKQSWD